ncbi:MAG: DNA recombination protein RmuC, partial [Chryseobacterium sp.]
MEMSYLFIGFIVGGISGGLILYFMVKSSRVSRTSYDELSRQNIKMISDLENANE